LEHHFLTEIDGVCETLSGEASWLLMTTNSIPEIHLHWEVSTVLVALRGSAWRSPPRAPSCALPTAGRELLSSTASSGWRAISRAKQNTSAPAFRAVRLLHGYRSASSQRLIARLGGYRERSAGRVSVMGRNALDALGQQITGRRMADVTQTDDADHPLALVHHRQPAEL